MSPDVMTTSMANITTWSIMSLRFCSKLSIGILLDNKE